MQDAEGADAGRFPAHGEEDSRRVAGEEGGIWCVCVSDELSASRTEGQEERDGLPSTSSIQYPCSCAFCSPSSRVMKADFSINMMRSSKPCTCSKPDVLPYQAAAKWRSFRAPRSALLSLKTTSLTSKTFMGTLWRLFSRIVFNSPGMRMSARSGIPPSWGSASARTVLRRWAC